MEAMSLSDIVAILAVAISIWSLMFAYISAKRSSENINLIAKRSDVNINNISNEVMEKIGNIHADERRLSLIRDFINASRQNNEIGEYGQNEDYIVEFGDKVRIRFLDDESLLREVVISEYRSNPKRGVISVATPLGAALIGKQLYDVTEFMIDNKVRKIKIEHITKEGV